MFTTLRKNVGCYRRDRSGPDDREAGGLARELRYLRACVQYPSVSLNPIESPCDGCAHARVGALTAAKADVGFRTRFCRTRLAACGQRVEGRRMNSRRVIHRLIEIYAAMGAVIGGWPLSRCRSGGCTQSNSASWASYEPHPNDDGGPGKNRKYEQRKEPKGRGPMDKSDRDTDAACSHREAKPRQLLLQTVSNRHGPHPNV
jgi:hypothetical protein